MLSGLDRGATALLLLLGFAGALYYRGEFGYQLAGLVAGLIALHLWLLTSLQRAWRRGLPIPLGGIGGALLLWWIWLALGLYWHPVPYTGRVAFWLLGCAPLGFLVYVAAPDRERLWPVVVGVLGTLATGLAGWGVWEYAVEGAQPHSIFLNANSHAALLNLVAPLLAGLFVSGAGPPARRRAALLAPALALMVFSVATVQGRASSGALWLGLLLVLGAGARERFLGRPLRWLALVGICLLAFLAGALGPVRGRHESALERVVRSAAEPGGLLEDRRLLWSTSYTMLRDAPWHGAGLGTFHSYFAPRRHPADRSSGTHAHNDYLEIGFEAGPPALMLTLLVGLSTLVGFARIQLAGRAPPERRLQAASLLAGLVAVASHSLTSFNFYQPGIMLAVGLLLGRLQSLVPASGVARIGAAPLAVAWAATLVVVVQAARLGAAQAVVHWATSHSGEAASLETDALFARALALAPELDATLFARAYWCLLWLRAHPSAPLDEQRGLLARALGLAARAERANRYRPLIPQLQAALSAADPDLDPARKREIAIAAQRRMLEIDPRSLEPRLRLAGLLRKAGRAEEARDVLEAGSAYRYGYGSYAHLEFRAALAQVRLEAGDVEGAAEAAREVDRMLERRGQPPGFLERLQVQRRADPD